MGLKFYCNEQFFETWSDPMAYALGYIYADGSLENSPYMRGKYIRVSSIDKSIIVNMKTLLSSKHSIVRVQNMLPRKPQYLLRIGSHALYFSLTKHGLFPNKSLTVTFPKIPLRYLAPFVRGYFDGDGCVYIERDKKKKIKRLTVVFTSGSFVFLKQLGIILKGQVQLTNNSVYTNRRSFQLRYSTADSIKLFKFFYRGIQSKNYLERKIHVFQRYFMHRPLRVDKKVAYVLNKIKMA